MLRFGARRVAELVLVLVVVSFVTFLIAQFLPGNPAATILGPHHSPAEYARLRHQLGLDQPFFVQYWHWLRGVVTGDLGRSLLPPRPAVASLIASTLPVSLELALLALLMALALAVPLALWAAAQPGHLRDRAVGVTSYALLATPEFLAGLLLILLFVVIGHDLPRLGWVGLGSGIGPNLRHALLPALALALPQAAYFTQILRDDLVSTMRQEFMLALRATGEPPVRLMVRGALRPSLFSLVTLAGVNLGYLIGGTAVVETLFGLPGLGSLLVTSAGGSDVPVLQAAVLVLALIYVVANTGIDLLYAALDPRIRRGTV